MEGEILITKEDLKEYAKKKNYNLGQAEKDYIQEIILFILYKEHGRNIVFKGGTALTKCYGLDRFSEDLDFTAEKKENFSKTINKGLNDFYIEYEFEEKERDQSIDLNYKIQGPLYNGHRNSLCKILLDISLREKLLLRAETKKIGLNIEEIPLFEIIVMSEREILAEKIRALMTRNKARDLYDTYNLLLKKANPSINEINQKLKLVNKEFNKKELIKAIEQKEIIWESELKPLVKSYPKFEETKKFLEEWINTNLN